MEMFDIINEKGDVIGQAPRSQCHGDPSFLHRAVHVVIFHPETGDILLQKRSKDKDIQPGRWDTAVGGHLDPGEDFMDAAKRETHEELGIDPEYLSLIHLFDTEIRNEIESENIRVYATWCAGPFSPRAEEIDELRFWSPTELREGLGSDTLFTPNLRTELRLLMDYHFDNNLPINLV